MAERCGHGFLKRTCTVRTCDHFDGGRERKKATTIKEFCQCHGCKAIVRREKLNWKGNNPFCDDCFKCAEGCGNLRREKSRWCQACFDKLSKPKECKVCGDLLTCAGSLDGHVNNHIKRDKCVPCGRRATSRGWYRKATAHRV